MRIRITALLLTMAVTLTACPNSHPPDFSFDVDPDGVVLVQGGNSQLTLTVMPSYGFSGTINLQLEGGPNGVSMSPTMVNVSGGNSQSFTLTFSASSSAEIGAYAARLKASSGGISHEIGVGIRVKPPAGSLDVSFGDNGVSILQDLLQVQGSSDIGHSLALDAGGKILLLSEATDGSGQRLVLTRIKDDGSPDASFGTTNLSPISGGVSYDLDRAVRVDPLSGKILVSGYTSAGAHGDDAFLARLNANGGFDGSFGGGDGWTSFDSLAGGNGNDRAYSLVQDEDGKIAFAGYSARSSGDAQAYLARAKADGSGLDSSFGGNGVKAGGDSDFDAFYSVARTPGGGYVAVGTSKGAHYRLQVAKFSASGQLDSNFNGGAPLLLGGIVEASDQDDRAYSVTVDKNGKILVTGYGMGASAGSTFDLVVLRLNPNGSLDTSFGDGGKVVIDRVGGGTASGSDVGYSIALDALGRILVAGVTYVQDHTSKDLFVLRLKPNGARDATFGNNGVFVWDGGHGDDAAYEVLPDSQGRVLLTGYTTNADGDKDVVTMRLNP